MSRTGAIAVLVALLAASGSAAQEATPEGKLLPYPDYLAALEEFTAASSATMADLGPASTVADVVAAYEQSIELVKLDLQRLHRVVPEPCYAAAHEEVSTYRETGVELIEETLPLMAESETLSDVMARISEIDVDLHARHPIAYIDDPDIGGGFRGSVRNILAALATCDEPANPPSARSPSQIEEPWFGGRVEILEHGFAVTVPDDWAAFDLTGDLGEQVQMIAILLDQDASTYEVRTIAEGLYTLRDGGSQLGLLEDSGSRCGFQVLSAPDTGLDTYIASVSSALSSDESVDSAEQPRTIKLSAGSGFVVDVSFTEPEVMAALYIVERAESLGVVACSGSERPEDDWLSIAETFEFLPAEE